MSSITRNFSFTLILTLIVVGVVGVFSVNNAYAAAGDFTLTVNDELGTALAGATVTATCPGGASSITMTDAGGGAYTATAVNMQGAAADCADTEAITFVVAKDGYVTITNSSTTYTILSDPDTYTLSPGIKFAVKVTVDDETVENDIVTGVLVKTGDAFGTTCTEDGASGTYYCIVPLTDTTTDVLLQLNGYVQKTVSSAWSDRTSATDAQEVVTGTNLQFGQKITATREGDSAALSVATVTAGSGATSCDEDGTLGIYYCPVPIAQDGTPNDITIIKDGYVTDTTGDTTNRTLQTSVQGDVTVSSIDFGYTLTVLTSEVIGTNITATATTVEVGDDTARNTCVLSGGVWYCPVVLANSNGAMIARVNHDGYVDKNTYALVTGNNRTLGTDAQEIDRVSTVEYAYEVTGITTEQVAADITATTTGLTLGDPTGQNTCSFDTATWYCPVVLANSNGTLTGNVTLSGYVQTDYALTGSGSRAVSTDAQVTGITIADILYGNKITDVSQELSGALATVTAKAGDAYGTTCTESGTDWYCAVPLSDTSTTIQVEKDGYVTNVGNSFTADRTANTDAQQTKAVTGVQFAFVVPSATDEIGTAMSSATVKTGDAYGTTCTESGSAWYCAVPLANTGITIQLIKDGYVTDTATSFDADRTVATDAQQSKALTGIQYGYKVTGVADELTGALSTVTVTAGDAYAISCTENGGAWYCAVPLAHTSLTIKAVKDGYVTDTGTSFDTDRAVGTDAQETKAVTSVDFGYKLTALTSEVIGTNLTATATTVEVGDDTARNACTLSGGAWYCPVVLANSDGTMISRIVNDGYVDKNTYALVTGNNRTLGTDAQESDTVSTVQYAYTVTGITTEQIASDITATVTTLTLGDPTGQTACAFDTATWYCPIVIANSDGTLTGNVTKDGYVQTDYALTGSSSRSAHTDAQVAGVSAASILYGFKVTGVADELGGALSTVTVATGDAYGTTCTEDTGNWYCIVPLANTGIVIRAIKDGYVTDTTESFTADRTAHTNAQQTKAVTGTQFSQKITVTREGDSAALTGATVTTTGPTTFTEDGTTGIYYGPVTLANDNGTITVAKTGYKTNTSATASDRVAGTDAQGATTASGVLFQLKLISTDELATAMNISGLDTVTFNSLAPDYTSTNNAYWAVTGANKELRVREDGYVNAGTTNAGLLDVTTTASDQTVVTMGSGAAQGGAISGTGATAKGLQYALKTTVQREGDNAAVTGSTVTAGDSFGTTCTESGSTGIHYCAIPLANTGVINRIVKSGFVTKNLTYTDRTAVTDAQGALTATLSTQVDSTAPTADSQTPLDNATGVAVTVSPTLTFSEAMDPGTLNGGTIKIKKYSDDSDITSTILYNPSTYTANIDPDSNLSYSTQYYIWSDDAKDTSGNEVSTDYSTTTKASHEFTTAANSADVTAPTIDSQTPTDNSTSVAITVAPTLTFSEALDAATANGGTIQLRNYSTNAAISATVLYNSSTFVVTITPTSSLSNNTQYYLYSAGVKDVAGNSASTDYTATTKASHEFTTVAAGTGSLAVTSIDTVQSYATDDDTYANGFIWDIHATIPTNELDVSLKLDDFVSATDEILAEETRYCSEQSSDYDCTDDGEASTDYIYLSDANTYTDGPITIDSAEDLDTSTSGIQVIIRVMTKVPSGTDGGSYSSMYGIQSA